ncbi:MAG: hypothetical protein ACPW60_10165 [Methylohalobius sp. ZOD2]
MKKRLLLMAMFPGVVLAAPGVTVLSPESGESFFAGDTVYVQWEGNEVESCQVEFPDGVEENLSSSGVFITPPLSQSGSGAVTVTCQTADGQSVSDSASFTVQPAPPAPDPIADITLLPEIGLFDEYNPGETVQVSWEVDTTRASVDTCIGVIDNSPFTNIVPLYPDLGEEDETFEIGSVSGSINLEADHDRRIEISCINNEVDFRASSSALIKVKDSTDSGADTDSGFGVSPAPDLGQVADSTDDDQGNGSDSIPGTENPDTDLITVTLSGPETIASGEIFPLEMEVTPSARCHYALIGAREETGSLGTVSGNRNFLQEAPVVLEPDILSYTATCHRPGEPTVSGSDTHVVSIEPAESVAVDVSGPFQVAAGEDFMIDLEVVPEAECRYVIGGLEDESGDLGDIPGAKSFIRQAPSATDGGDVTYTAICNADGLAEGSDTHVISVDADPDALPGDGSGSGGNTGSDDSTDIPDGGNGTGGGASGDGTGTGGNGLVIDSETGENDVSLEIDEAGEVRIRNRGNVEITALRTLSLFSDPRIYLTAWQSSGASSCALSGHVSQIGDFPVSDLPPSGITLYGGSRRGDKQVNLTCSDANGAARTVTVRGDSAGPENFSIGNVLIPETLLDRISIDGDGNITVKATTGESVTASVNADVDDGKQETGVSVTAGDSGFIVTSPANAPDSTSIRP